MNIRCCRKSHCNEDRLKSQLQLTWAPPSSARLPCLPPRPQPNCICCSEMVTELNLLHFFVFEKELTANLE